MRGLVELTVVVLLYHKIKLKSRGSDVLPDRKSLLTLTSWMTGISGIRPTVKVRKRGFHKMADLDPETKQRVVVEFLTGEDVPPEEIRRRLESVYGNRTVDVDKVQRWARKPGDSEFRLGGRLMQRSVIQFLTAEGERPLEIVGRIRAVYRTLPYSRCTAWRWATRYRQGDTGVGDRLRQGRLPDRLRLNRTLTLR